MPTETRLTVTPQLTAGICLMLFGVLLTLDRLNLIAAHVSLRFWPAVLVVIGTLVFVQGRDASGRGWGLVLIVVGGWLLLNVLGLVRVRFWELFWPLAIVLLGASLIMQTLGRTGPVSVRASDWVHGRLTSLQTNSTGTVNLFAALGGSKRMSNDSPFRGGEMTAFMGGCQLDLRQATIAPGEEAVINVFAMMGGHEVWVPPAWSVVSQVVPLLGGVEDKRLPFLPAPTLSPSQPPPRLVLRGLVVMGGLIIRS